MNKWLFITITVILVGLFGVVMYYGMQALEPHTYTPQNDTTENIEPSVILPELPGLPEKQPLSNNNPSEDKPSLNPVKVLSTEDQLTYIATSTIREINPDKLFFAPSDTRAYPYGKDTIFVIERPSNLVRTSLWTINTTSKTVTRIAGPTFGLMAQWSKNGRYIFTMHTDGNGAITLSFIDTRLKTTTPLRMATLPSKCFIVDTTPVMYCGVPQGAPQNTLLPEDYLNSTFTSRDRIMKIDFKTPKVTELWSGDSDSLDIQNPIIIGNALFFTNRSDASIWKLAL